ncbi:hypothetical protein M427DRAFT_38272 [Gonapodya prolifera JEL478]|uniref:G-protein coupled receptors family 1 profile domain-containing protein n=1 Tax=Gonapodya prolifera (strain JEL478) TaxID=1344416 RepID=A0A138ZZB2_GONPJ|nr:hypothetical protein M427DRAFT_38272 [Gonapodya prolifera JEL478]|eukprot:KXS09847.1 hypothetical protein M427DRAFT_38272 [Gonapodya prolifera JEL478]
MDRQTRARYYAIPVSISVLADVTVMAFYAVAAGMRIQNLRRTLHRLIFAMFMFNAMALSSWLVQYLTAPATTGIGCRVDLFFQVGGFGAENYSALLVCVVLFRSLVLNQPELTSLGEAVILSITTICFVLGGIVAAFNGGIEVCEKSHADAEKQAFIMIIGLGFAFVVSMILVAITVISRTSRKTKDIPESLRVPEDGIMASSADVRKDANLLSVRLIMYPIIMFATGGLALIAMVAGSPAIQIVGEVALTLGGLLNALAFFTLDPTARKVSLLILQILNNDTDAGLSGSTSFSSTRPLSAFSAAELHQKRILAVSPRSPAPPPLPSAQALALAQSHQTQTQPQMQMQTQTAILSPTDPLSPHMYLHLQHKRVSSISIGERSFVSSASTSALSAVSSHHVPPVYEGSKWAAVVAQRAKTVFRWISRT